MALPGEGAYLWTFGEEMKLVLAIMIALGAIVPLGNAQNPTEPEKRKLKQLADQIESIAQALRTHKADKEGQLPKRLRDLVPNYLESKEELVLLHIESSLPKGVDNVGPYLVWIDGDGISHPDNHESSMIAFTPSEVPAGGRFAIDSNLEVWWLSEGAFQDWIFGRQLGEDSIPVEVIEPPDTEQGGDTNRLPEKARK